MWHDAYLVQRGSCNVVRKGMQVACIWCRVVREDHEEPACFETTSPCVRKISSRKVNKKIPLEGTTVELVNNFLKICFELRSALARMQFKVKVRDREVAV
jgi:hypothetical protein